MEDDQHADEELKFSDEAELALSYFVVLSENHDIIKLIQGMLFAISFILEEKRPPLQ
jgi:hypothetical protein